MDAHTLQQPTPSCTRFWGTVQTPAAGGHGPSILFPRGATGGRGPTKRVAEGTKAIRKLEQVPAKQSLHVCSLTNHDDDDKEHEAPRAVEVCRQGQLGVSAPLHESSSSLLVKCLRVL